jgi:hypothetical protein
VIFSTITHVFSLCWIRHFLSTVKYVVLESTALPPTEQYESVQGSYQQHKQHISSSILQFSVAWVIMHQICPIHAMYKFIIVINYFWLQFSTLAFLILFPQSLLCGGLKSASHTTSHHICTRIWPLYICGLTFFSFYFFLHFLPFKSCWCTYYLWGKHQVVAQSPGPHAPLISHP